MRIDAFERAHERPLLTAVRGDGSVLAYRAFLCPPARRRVQWCDVTPQSASRASSSTSRAGSSRGENLTQTRLTRFENIGDRGGYSRCLRGRGAERGGGAPEPRPWRYPMRGERANRAVSLSCFHNLNCRDDGSSSGPPRARICQIPGKMHYEAAWPVRKLALKCTPHHVRYLPDFKLYALSTSTTTKWPEPKIDEEDAHFVSLVNTRRAKARARGGLKNNSRFDFYNPERWRARGSTRSIPGSTSRRSRACSCGTRAPARCSRCSLRALAFPGGEDTPCRGAHAAVRRGVAHAVERARGTRSRRRGAARVGGQAGVRARGEDGVHGTLRAGGAPRHRRREQAHRALVGRRVSDARRVFRHAPAHVATIGVVKNFILLGDLQKGRFPALEGHRTRKHLTLLAKDFEHMDVGDGVSGGREPRSRCSPPIPPGTSSLSYDAKSTESWKGQKLLTKASFHVGSPVNRLVRYKLSAPARPSRRRSRAPRTKNESPTGTPRSTARWTGRSAASSRRQTRRRTRSCASYSCV